MSITVIYGPPGSGKTTNAAALARFYGASTIVDDGTISGQRFPADSAIVPTTRSPDEVQDWQTMSRRFGTPTFVPIAEALRNIGVKPKRWPRGKGSGQ